MYVYQIALDTPLRKNYSYKSKQLIAIGCRVVIEFNGKQRVGFVLSSTPQQSFTEYPVNKLAEIIRIDNSFVLDNGTLELAKFASQYYHHPFGETLFCGLPTIIKKLDNPKITIETEEYYQATTNDKISKSTKIQGLYEQLAIASMNSIQIKKILGNSTKTILEKWLANGLVINVAPPDKYGVTNELLLNEEQQTIVNNWQSHWNRFHVGLLYGITGSGKTEVFLHLIRQALEKNQQVLTLVPEINLTPQLLSRFENRFPNAKIAILSSSVTDNQRFNSWIKCQSGDVDIVIATRLGIFTPFKNLGLIIVDEEHDESFKQNESLRYNARDLAIWRANYHKIPIMLASATPSLESLYNYKLGKFTLYRLSNRAVLNAILPEINTINLQHYPVNHAGISDVAMKALSNCLNRKEIALVFINRRGYAPIISCYDCGWVSTCNHCSSNLVYHHKNRILKCHHCGYQISIPPNCPKCHNQYLHTIGHGTQKLEEFLTHTFKESNILRIDRDTTNSKKDWQEIYNKIENNQVDILIGTQMLAKGHDFANLTLVIGLNLDNALFSYDFRASEDMFNMITQVSGRAGRSNKKGQVLLQTNYPNHPIYNFIKEHDFNGFINYTLKERKAYNQPPYSYYAIIKFSSLEEDKLLQTMKNVHQLARKIPHHDITIFDAIKAVMYKSHNRFRGQILICSNQRKSLHNYLSELETHLKPTSTVTITIDIDPLEV